MTETTDGISPNTTRYASHVLVKDMEGCPVAEIGCVVLTVVSPRITECSMEIWYDKPCKELTTKRKDVDQSDTKRILTTTMVKKPPVPSEFAELRTVPVYLFNGTKESR